MEGRSRLLLWEIYQVWDDWIEGSGSCEALNRHDSSLTITYNIWIAYAGSWYEPWTITNTASDLSTGTLSNEVGFWETESRQSDSISDARCGALFVTNGECEASSTHKLLPLHIASLANDQIQIRFGRRHGNGSCVTGGVDSTIGTFDDVSQAKAIWTYSVTWQLILDPSNHIVRQDYSSVGVPGSYRPCECSSLPIKVIDKQWTVCGVACHG